MGASLTIAVPEETGDVPSDAFLDVVRTARASGRKKAAVRCHSEWSWLMAGMLLRDVMEVTWERTAAAAAAATNDELGATGAADTTIVLLGNLPINPTTLTIDSYARMQKAADVYAASVAHKKRAVVICCGGHSLYTFQGNKFRAQAGYPSCLSEAQMMAAWLLLTRKVPRRDLMLEDQSMTTNENGKLASAFIERLRAREVALVSKADHLVWAQELYVQYPRLAGARMEGAVVDKAELMAQLRRHAERGDAFAATRLGYLEEGTSGLD